MENDPAFRKSVSMPESMWMDIARYQREERITTEAETIRRIVLAGLRALKLTEP